jgi:hypothetical protein
MRTTASSARARSRRGRDRRGEFGAGQGVFLGQSTKIYNRMTDEVS